MWNVLFLPMFSYQNIIYELYEISNICLHLHPTASHNSLKYLKIKKFNLIHKLNFITCTNQFYIDTYAHKYYANI